MTAKEIRTGRIELSIVGAGNMAEALLRGALSAGVLDREGVLVSDPQRQRRELFVRELGVRALDDNRAVADAPRLLLAVKPQTIATVLEEMSPLIWADALIVTIAAGIRTSFLASRLDGRGRIVRVMPNTPMLVGAGTSAICPGPGATDADLDWVEKLFAACGRTVRVEEEMMDAVTAVSGSGPAYFFYLVETMVAAGVAEGLSEAVAMQLAVETCRGAGELLARSRQRPEALRAKVTSPGGTTQAAIESMESAGVRAALVAAIRRAAERSRELGK